MSLNMRWVGQAESARVGETRCLCYAPGQNELQHYRERAGADGRILGDDYLLAEQDGIPVGTATSLSMHMWVRGGRVPVQGVASVGAIKTHRRRGGGEPGIATGVMREVVRKARERGDVASALMPFRASYYEHFGYGIVERRNDWQIPLSILPSGDFNGIRFYQPGDRDALFRCRQRAVEAGQCDIERTPGSWERHFEGALPGYIVVDRPEGENGDIESWMAFENTTEDGKDIVRVVRHDHVSLAAFTRQLHFLASLRDQYFAANLILPVDLPLNWLIKERQVPHRPVNHSTARWRTHTRMQVRVLDHKKFIEVQHLPAGIRGQVAVAIQETEGDTSQIWIDLSDNRAAVSPTKGTTDFQCTDRVWAAIVCGDLSATDAVRFGLAECSDTASATVLDAFAVGPKPFCEEYF